MTVARSARVIGSSGGNRHVPGNLLRDYPLNKQAGHARTMLPPKRTLFIVQLCEGGVDSSDETLLYGDELLAADSIFVLSACHQQRQSLHCCRKLGRPRSLPVLSSQQYNDAVLRERPFLT